MTSEPQFPPRRLLVLDDDNVVATIVALLAERAGFATRIAATREDFFEYFARWQPTHVTLDLMLPDGDGIEMIRALPAGARTAALIIVSSVSGKVLDSARLVAESCGFRVAGSFAKPLDFGAFSELLHRDMDMGSLPVGAYADAVDAPLPDDVLAALAASAQIVMHYQPKIELRSGTVVGVEALVRWQHPQHGLLYPDFIIPHFERNHAIHSLTPLIIERSLEWFSTSMRSWNLTLAINLSGRDLEVENLADYIAEACACRAISPKQVILELTETSATSDSRLALETLTRLRIKGFGLALDDFGTGYSSIVQLARLPFSALKVDRSFVQHLEHSPESRKIVKSIIGLGHSLDLDVVAEGAETLASVRCLRQFGADSAQGFFMARAMPEGELYEWIQGWNPADFANALAGGAEFSNAGTSWSEQHEFG